VKGDPEGPIGAVVERLATCGGMTGPVEWTVKPDASPPKGSARVVLPDAEMYVPLSHLIDLDAEVARLRKESALVRSELDRAEAKLANAQFLARAPEDVVAKERGKRDEFRQKRERLEANLASLRE